MNFTIDLWSLLTLISTAQGLFVLSLLLAKKEWYQPPSVFLISIILTFIWFQMEFYAIRFPFDVGFNLFYGTRYGSWMLLGPLYFLYLKASLQAQDGFKLKDLLHFLPFLTFVLIIPLALQSDGLVNHWQVQYGMLTPFYPYKQETTFLNYLYTSIFIFQFIHLVIYLLIGAVMIRRYKSNFLEINSNMNKHLIWLQRLNLAMLVVLLFVTAFLIIFFFTKIYRRHLDYLYVIPLAIILYIIAYRLMKVHLPDVSFNINSQNKKYEKSSLTKQQSNAYAQKIKSYLQIEKPYLKNDLRLNDLAEALNIPSHHLSQVINGEMNTRFFDLINQCRVVEAQLLMEKKPNASLLEIAYEAGFNNKTSFNNAFKKHTQNTPSAYRKKIVFKN